MTPERAKIVEKHMRRLRNLIRRPVCLAEGPCGGEIGRSHTVSSSSSLSMIAESDHVLIRSINLFAKSEDEVLLFKRTSINEALTFPGFCNQHDQRLFESLDQSQFMATPEQLFMQAYRCACREYYFKACQIDATLDANQMAELQGLPSGIEYKLPPALELAMASMSQGMSDAITAKNKFEVLLANREFRRLRTYIIYGAGHPVIACAGAFFPDYITSGEPLQNYTDCNTKMQDLFVSIIPDASGSNVLLSFFDDEASAPTRFIEDLLKTDNLTHRLIWMCMTRLENLAVKPSWWNGLPEGTRTSISDALNYNTDMFDERLPTFDRMPRLDMDNWDIRHQCWI